MNRHTLYQDLLTRLQAVDIFSPAFPDETTEVTLKALWSTAMGMPCSAVLAQTFELPPELPDEKKATLMSLVEKRIAGTPLAHLTGRVHFMGCELFSSPDVLVPRAETELLGITVVDILTKRYSTDAALTGIDVGSGSGNLSCAIASKLPRCSLYAVDVTASCVDLTRKNAKLLHLEDRITVFKGDLFSPLAGAGLEGTLDFIVSNPPYIPSSKLIKDLSHLVSHEPEEAFNGGLYGFSIHQRLIRESLTMLKPGGHLLFEFGIGQEKQIQALFKRVAGYEQIVFKNDNNGNPRVAIAMKKSLSS